MKFNEWSLGLLIALIFLTSQVQAIVFTEDQGKDPQFSQKAMVANHLHPQAPQTFFDRFEVWYDRNWQLYTGVLLGTCVVLVLLSRRHSARTEEDHHVPSWRGLLRSH